MPTTHAYPSPTSITRTVLGNGMIVLARENHSAPIVALEGYLPTGNIHDPAGKAGLSAFVASMLTRGSARYDFDSLNEAIEGVGASLTVHADNHVTNFSLRCLDENFAMLLDLLADALRRPTFPPQLVARLRNQRLVNLQEQAQDTSYMANLRCSATLFPEHPYGQPIAGDPESVRAITRADIEDFYTTRYTPAGAILAVSGAIDPAAALALVDELLGDWQGDPADQTVTEVHFPATPQRIDHLMPGKYQADIVVGLPAVARSHPDYYAIRVANTVLGVFGLMGRLGETVREEQGLAYYAYSSQIAERAAGAWLAAAGVNPGQVEPALAVIYRELERLAREPVPEAELADSQAYLTGMLPVTLETNEGVAGTLANMEWQELGLDYLTRYPTLINAVTQNDVQRVAETYLMKPSVTVVAGPEA